jgi:predicted metal-binding membrane protein
MSGLRALFHGLGRSPSPILFGLAGCAFLVTAFVDGSSRIPGFCGTLSQKAFTSMASILAQLVSPSAIVIAWVIMLVAMMPPLLIDPIGHVCHSSFAARRPRAVTMFVIGYGLVWMAVGLLLLPMALMLRILVSETQAGIATLALAIVWSCTPAAQVARNLCHSLRRISAFGLAADRDCFVQGLAIGLPCVAACWPWMLVPMVIGSAHLAVMLVVTILLFLERIAPPQPPVWQWPPSLGVVADVFRWRAGTVV